MYINGAPKYWFLNTVLLCEKPGLLGEMIDLKAGEGSIQDKPGTSHGARKKKVPRKKMGHDKRTGHNLKKLLMAKAEII